MQAREHYAHHGPAPLSDEALLALVIGTGVATRTGHRSAERIAAALLSQHGGLRGLARASVGGLARVPGVGPARAVRLHAALALGRRACSERDGPGPPIVASPDDAWRLLRPDLEAQPAEELHALYLGVRGHLKARRCLTRGSDRNTVVDPRQVFRPAVELAASSVVVAHNHPSGDPSPSEADVEVTRRLASAGRVLGVHLVDHLVLGQGRYVSLAQEGVLRAWTRSGPSVTG